ncbi:hypothetical protein VTO73DRAFT_2536 [Trametes versicolor]
MHRSIYIHSLDLHLTLPLCACPPMSRLGPGLSALTLPGLPMPPPNVRTTSGATRDGRACCVSYKQMSPLRYVTLRCACAGVL